MSTKIYLDQNGYNQLLQELADEEEKLNKIHSARREENNLRENLRLFDFNSDDSDITETIIQKRIKELKSKIKNTVIIDSVNTKDCVNIGCKVKLLLDYGDEQEEGIYTLLASDNIKISSNGITINSPLGMAIHHKKVNDVVQYSINSFTTKVTILEIL